MRANSPSILKALNCIAFERIDENIYELTGLNVPWLNYIVEQVEADSRIKSHNMCHFLADFLFDAEAFWAKGEDGSITSGIWTQDSPLGNGECIHLEATASLFDNQLLLIVSNCAAHYKEKQNTLQKARELETNNEALLKQHDYIKERLHDVLQGEHGLHNALDVISTTVNNANLGVLVTDLDMAPVIQNAMFDEIFESSHTHLNSDVNKSAHNTLFSLIQTQFPEYDRVIQTQTSKEVEIYWVNEPLFMKWLKLSLHPIKNNNEQTTHWLFVVSDITLVKHLQKQNQQLALYDRLTELPNRQFFWQILDNITSLDSPFFVLYLDINRFKYINEVHGHTAGDELLVCLSQRFKSILNKEDILARIGGDEFAVVLYGVSSISACQKMADKLIETACTPVTTQSLKSVSISLCVGAVGYPQNANTSENLMKFADLAAFNAKTSSKNTVSFFSNHLQSEALRKIALENAIREAIENENFQLYFQPMLDVSSGKVLKAETLLRWQHSEDKWISPEEFIPIAEESGLIVPLGKWVFKRACEYLKQLEVFGFDVRISINLSPKQFSDRKLLDFINETLTETQVDPSNIELEITEGVLISDFEKMLSSLESFRQRGITISIDDFGTGYSSLAYLKKLPIDNLKIDRSFIKDLDSDDNDKTIILAIIAMAHQLKLAVVAEGVETNEQQDFLESNRCNTIQGYIFSRPMNFYDFCHFLKQKN